MMLIFCITINKDLLVLSLLQGLKLRSELRIDFIPGTTLPLKLDIMAALVNCT